jgi:hypothetical protein
VVQAPSSRRGDAWHARVVAVGASQRVLPGLPAEVGGILRRHWVAALPPAALLGAAADAVLLLHDHFIAEILAGLAIAVAFELYIGYAELIVGADRSAGPRPSVLVLLARALPLTAGLVLASIVAVTVPLAATGLLVIPGLYLLTRWALFAPAIVHERLGPWDALHRSSELVRGAFWVVFLTVTISVLIEHAVIHATAHEAEPALGSLALGLLGAAIATALVSAPAAFTISIVYERLAAGVHAPPAIGEPAPSTTAAPAETIALEPELRRD